MRALSIRQPWANAIVYHGKDVENRTWATNYRGPVLIHAGKTWGREEKEALAFLEKIIFGKRLGDMQCPRLGGIIGQADIVDCVTNMDSPWFGGPYGFVLANVKPRPFRPCRGALGFFTPKFE